MDPPPGLYIIPEWITEEVETEIVYFLCKGEWDTSISKNRPVQHFGYKYELKGYDISLKKMAEKDWGPIENLAKRLETQHKGVKISQALANLYFRDSGIGPHIDKESPYVVFGVSLCNDINMDWILEGPEPKKRRILIPRRSLYIMTGDSVSKWKHCVPTLKTIEYPSLRKRVTKPDDYTRVSITFRHFEQAIIDGEPLKNRSLQTNSLSLVSNRSPKPNQSRCITFDGIRAIHIKGIIPDHQNSMEKLFNEHQWKDWKSRFGKPLSRKVCHESNMESKTSSVYATWIELLCKNVMGADVTVVGAFANYYPNGKASLPAHRDQYDCWIVSLSFGATRRFSFIPNDSKLNREILDLESGDVLIFAPDVNDTHKHEIKAQSQNIGPRINITYFVKVDDGSDESNLVNQSIIDSNINKIPDFSDSLYKNKTNIKVRTDMYDHDKIYEQTGTPKDRCLMMDMKIGTTTKRIILMPDKTVVLVLDTGNIQFDSIEELAANVA